MTPRIDKPSLLMNRKDGPAFPQHVGLRIPTREGWKTPIEVARQHLMPGPAGALKPVEKKETT